MSGSFCFLQSNISVLILLMIGIMRDIILSIPDNTSKVRTQSDCNFPHDTGR